MKLRTGETDRRSGAQNGQDLLLLGILISEHPLPNQMCPIWHASCKEIADAAGIDAVA